MFEQQIRFIVPGAVAGEVRSALESVTGHCDEFVLSARYFDTPDNLFADNGASLRLRREAEQWIQTWSLPTGDGLTHIEHNLPLDHGSLALAGFVGRTGVDRIIGDVDEAATVQDQLRQQCQLVFERTRSVINHESATGDCVCAVSLDAGEIRARRRQSPVLELTFSLISGDLASMIDIAAQWQARHGLIWFPCGMASVGGRLAARQPLPHRRARPVDLRSDCPVSDAANLILDECIAQISRNAAAISVGEATPAHISLCRQGLRRFSAACQLFDGWIDLPEPGVRKKCRQLRRELGIERRRGMLRDKLLSELYAAGCGPLGYPLNTNARLSDGALNGELQALLMTLLAWRYCARRGKRANASFQASLIRRLNKRLRSIRRCAGQYNRDANESLKACHGLVRDLQIWIGFVRSLLPKKHYRRLSKIVRSARPLLREWRMLGRAAALINTDQVPAGLTVHGERGSRQFAAGWLAGRMTGLGTCLAPVMRRLARRRIRIKL